MVPGIDSIFVMRPVQKLYMIRRKQCSLLFIVKYDIAQNRSWLYERTTWYVIHSATFVYKGTNKYTKTIHPHCVFSHWNQQIIGQHNMYCKQYKQLRVSAVLIAIIGRYKREEKCWLTAAKRSNGSQNLKLIHTPS